MDQAAPVQPGQVLAGKFRVDRILGVGGMGVVVSAMHLHLDKMVALKFMLETASRNEVVAARFSREARAAAKLRSEHIASVLDVGVLENGAPYMVMEYLEGQDLEELVRERVGQGRGPVPTMEACDFMLQACLGMAEAHSKGVIHRDLKPPNLFCTRRSDGTPLIKVLDFGIAKADMDGLVTKTQALLGTPFYMSPEQWKSARNVDARGDVWALGAILQFLLSGHAPFEGESIPTLFTNISTEPPRPFDASLNIPEGLAQLILDCLAKSPDDRPQSVAHLAARLAPFGGAHAAEYVRKSAALLSEGAPLVAISHANRPTESSVGPTSSVTPSPAHSLGGAGKATTMGANTGEIAAAVPPATHPARVDKPARSKLVPALVGLVLVAGLGVVASQMGETKSAPNANAVSAQETLDAGVALPATLSVRISTSPEGAKIFLDGAPLSDVTPHVVIAEAGADLWLSLELDGYQRYQKQHRIDTEDAISIALVALEAPEAPNSEAADAAAKVAAAKAAAAKAAADVIAAKKKRAAQRAERRARRARENDAASGDDEVRSGVDRRR